MTTQTDVMALKIGKAFVYGDDINTDVLAPGAYLKFSVEEQAKHCLQAIDPNFVSTVQPDDVVVGGENFGVGSSREQAAISLVILGVRYVIAKNFSRIFYRNAFNVGLIPLISAEVEEIESGDNLRIDPFAGNVANLTKNQNYRTAPVPEHLMKIVQAGGLLVDLKKRLEEGGIRNARYRKTP